MKKISNAITVFAVIAGLFVQPAVALAQWSTTYPTYDTGSWSTTYPTYDTGSWSTTYPTYDTGSWSTTYPTYDTGSWSTTYPTYDTGSWSTTYPTYDTGSWSTTYPTYDTGVNYSTVNYSTTNYSTTPTYTNVPTYVAPTYTNIPTYTAPTYVAPTYTAPTYTTIPTYTTTPTYTYPTTNTIICSDGLPPVNGSCNRTTTIPTTNTTVCSDGLPRNANGTCTRTTTIPVTTNTICADGLPPVNGSCIRTNTIPTVTNTVCSDGLAPINGSCVRTNTIPTTTTTVCSDGSAPSPVTGCNRTIVQPVTTTQVCWDGSVIPLSSVCPAQFKTCANGTSIPVHQTCYYGTTHVPYVPPVTVKFNNVVTSVVTEITNSSARCNGIGLIASGAQSAGWFEYGETPNLGRETSHANIGSSPTSPFSNKLVNLKPLTTYYCRAVMQNQYGTVKGEVVSFRTKATAVSYVKPVTKTTTTKTVATKTVAKKTNEVICVDGKVVTLESKTAAQLLNSGEKLVSLQIEKVSGTLSAGSQVNYRLSFKNLSDETLRGMTIKIVLPPEIVLANAQSGQYDPSTRTLTVTHPVLPAYGEGQLNWTGTVGKDAAVGKSVVTTAYTNYSVPGSQAQDEVTAYTVGSIVAGNNNDTGTTSTGAKKVIGASTDRGFLPDSLVEWLALIAILFIIFVLGRSVYASYQNDKKTA